MKKINIAFFGSSEFSLSTLNELILNEKFNISAVITSPAVIKNRGKQLHNNVVYDFAIENGITKEKIYTPESLKNNTDFINLLSAMELDFIIVVSYGKIIPQAIIDLPKYDILNLHPSRLPRFRGASPIERAIENGDDEIDICIMKVVKQLDAGDVAMRKVYKLDNNKCADEIVPEISTIGSKMIIDAIFNDINGNIKWEKQAEEGMVYAEKIDKKELFIDLSNENITFLSVDNVFNKIRAFNNNGGCYFLYQNQRVKILKAKILEKVSYQVDRYGFNKKDGCLYFKDGVIMPLILQKEGKKPITIKDFLNGIK